jgi:hypothetical protein
MVHGPLIESNLRRWQNYLLIKEKELQCKLVLINCKQTAQFDSQFNNFFCNNYINQGHFCTVISHVPSPHPNYTRLYKFIHTARQHLEKSVTRWTSNLQLYHRAFKVKFTDDAAPKQRHTWSTALKDRHTQ